MISASSCLAKTRSGELCQRAGSPKNGRCHLHGGASTGPRTEEGRARIAAAQFKHGGRSKAFVEAQRARNAKGRAIKRRGYWSTFLFKNDFGRGGGA